jgi:hypothetical protein
MSLTATISAAPMILIVARDRGTSGGSESFWSLRVRLSELHGKEERADARDREGGDRSRQERPPLHREERTRGFSHNGYALFSGIEIRNTNSETPSFEAQCAAAGPAKGRGSEIFTKMI